MKIGPHFGKTGGGPSTGVRGGEPPLVRGGSNPLKMAKNHYFGGILIKIGGVGRLRGGDPPKRGYFDPKRGGKTPS